MMADLFSLLKRSERDDSQADATHLDLDAWKLLSVMLGSLPSDKEEEPKGLCSHGHSTCKSSGWNTDPYKPEIIDGKLASVVHRMTRDFGSMFLA